MIGHHDHVHGQIQVRKTLLQRADFPVHFVYRGFHLRAVRTEGVLGAIHIAEI